MLVLRAFVRSSRLAVIVGTFSQEETAKQNEKSLELKNAMFGPSNSYLEYDFLLQTKRKCVRTIPKVRDQANIEI
jgi:hypothetical protein